MNKPVGASEASAYAALWSALLPWYAQYGRDLPWRRTRDAYAILVSEIMLQQTGVERVIPSYRAFLERFPTLDDLAAAPTADVIRLWAGLGYNRRAVWLQQAARRAIERWGSLPGSIEDLLELPGIGPYTARAVACFAFGAQAPVVDTNIRRVLTRVLIGDPTTAPGERDLLALGESVLPPGRAYEWNQALMDLGASVCTHYSPRCLICPLQESCKAFPALGASPPSEVVAEAKPRWKESPFIGSRRYYRGHVVAAVRGLPDAQSVTLPDLGALIKEDFAEADVPWLEKLLADLERDGLLVVREGKVSLPG